MSCRLRYNMTDDESETKDQIQSFENPAFEGQGYYYTISYPVYFKCIQLHVKVF